MFFLLNDIFLKDDIKFFESFMLTEMERIMVKFKKYRIRGLDGWTIKLFLSFLDLMGMGIMRFIQEGR